VPKPRVTVGAPLLSSGVDSLTSPASLDSPVAPGLGEDSGPHPVARAVTGLLLGLGVGLASALFLPRRHKSLSAATTTDPCLDR
jgi:hypothetical protein